MVENLVDSVLHQSLLRSRISNDVEQICVGFACHQSAKLCFHAVRSEEEIQNVVEAKVWNFGLGCNGFEQSNVSLIITDTPQDIVIICIYIVYYAGNAFEQFQRGSFF
ncbi:hypothetical protein D3C75_662600 [compost metagenome]